jgi:hypothetical protein
MLIATTIAAAALLAASSLDEAPAVPRQMPPLVVAVSADTDLPPKVVSALLAEAGEIWRPAGVTFEWRRSGRLPRSLNVTIGRSPGRQTDDALPLAWITFDADTAPQREIYVSYGNVLALMERSRGVVGTLERMPRGEFETLLSRALGRALAHEIGHYLLASKAHTRSGLMQTRRTAVELFAVGRVHFDIDAVQRRQIAARVEQLMLAQHVGAETVSEGL